MLMKISLHIEQKRAQGFLNTLIRLIAAMRAPPATEVTPCALHVRVGRNALLPVIRVAHFAILLLAVRVHVLGESLKGIGLGKAAEDRVAVRYADGRTADYDAIYYFLGGSTPRAFLEKIGLSFVDDRPKVDTWGETEIPGLFLAGDLAVEKGSIMAAFNSGTLAMRRICSILKAARQ